MSASKRKKAPHKGAPKPIPYKTLMERRVLDLQIAVGEREAILVELITGLRSLPGRKLEADARAEEWLRLNDVAPLIDRATRRFLGAEGKTPAIKEGTIYEAREFEHLFKWKEDYEWFFKEGEGIEGTYYPLYEGKLGAEYPACDNGKKGDLKHLARARACLESGGLWALLVAVLDEEENA